MARAVWFDRHPFERTVRWRTVASTFDWVRCAQMLPMLCREVVEGEQSIAVFGQAFDRLLVFNVVDFDERVECDESILLGPGHPDLLQCALGLCLLALRQLVQNICGLVHPTALAARLWPNLLERLPEPECTVTASSGPIV